MANTITQLQELFVLYKIYDEAYTKPCKGCCEYLPGKINSTNSAIQLLNAAGKNCLQCKQSAQSMFK